MTEQATLIWHRDPAAVHHRDWIRYLLGEVFQEEIIDLEGKICKPCSIVVEDNRSETPSSFFEMAAERRPIGLFHISDQYFAFDYSKYRMFDFVIKTHWSSAFETDRILVVPIGYHSDLPFSKDVILASQRPLLWSFAGGLKSSRYEMVRTLSDLEPHLVHGTTGVQVPKPSLTKRQYVDLLQDSVFCPSPMGNVIMESWRLYESLQAGCIPIVEKRLCLRYYERLLKNPPFLFVWSWKEAKKRMLELTADPGELDRRQRQIQGWWQKYKSDLRQEVTSLVTEAFTGHREPGAGSARARRITNLPGWHYAELLRHQSLQSLRWRFGRNLLGGRLRVPY